MNNLINYDGSIITTAFTISKNTRQLIERVVYRLSDVQMNDPDVSWDWVEPGIFMPVTDPQVVTNVSIYFEEELDPFTLGACITNLAMRQIVWAWKRSDKPAEAELLDDCQVKLQRLILDKLGAKQAVLYMRYIDREQG